jgi:NAD-dependent dihydropyrimidine dehydrogenase PreA subunit
MKTLRYIDGVTSIALDEQACIGCGMCLTVCPQAVFILEGKKARIVDRDGCMECGACALNCPASAIAVNPGVGCASLLINRWLKRKKAPTCDCC